jgi:hypothetical protein
MPSVSDMIVTQAGIVGRVGHLIRREEKKGRGVDFSVKNDEGL